MEVILIKEVSNLGYPGDILNVKDGYARNYLLPLKMCVRKTPIALEKLKEQLKDFEQKTQQSKERYQSIIDQLKEIGEITVDMRCSKEGRIYGSVHAEALRAKLKEDYDLEIEKKKIIIRNPIKVIGEYMIDVQLDKKMKISFKLIVKAIEN